MSLWQSSQDALLLTYKRDGMEATNTLLLLTGLLLFVSVLASLLATRLGLPLLLIFLGVGMLAGEDGPGRIQFNDFQTAFLIGNLALAIILLDGGLRTNMQTFRVALRPALALATFGVIATAGLVAAFTVWVLGLDWRYGLLLGAIVGSTDAAAVFSLLRQSGIRLNERVRATLEIESGANDPMAIFLVLVMVEWIKAEQSPGAMGLLWNFVHQFGLGAAGGALGGFLLARLLERVRLAEGLYALLIASGGLALFAAVNLLGGSGFLAIYLAGLLIGNRSTHATGHVLRVMDGLAWLSQAGMFLVLGLLVTPTKLWVDAPSAILVAVFLMLVARPVAIWLSLLPFHFPRREAGFIAWVGLRGAVPIVLALFPVMAGVENSALLFHVAFAVVLVSLVAQGSTMPWIARLFRVQVPQQAESLDRIELALPLSRPADLLQISVEADAPCIGRRVNELLGSVMPETSAVCVALAREGRLVFPDKKTEYTAGDVAVVIATGGNYEKLARAFARLPAEGPLSTQRFFGEFVLNGSARAADVAAIYGAALEPDEQSLTVAELMERRLNRKLVVGDRVAWGSITITVREIDHDVVTKVGLKLAKTAQR